jgi:hypothetical protein
VVDIDREVAALRSAERSEAVKKVLVMLLRCSKAERPSRSMGARNEETYVRPKHLRDSSLEGARLSVAPVVESRRRVELNKLIEVMGEVRDIVDKKAIPHRKQLKDLKAKVAAVGKTSRNPKWMNVYEGLRGELHPEDLSRLLDDMSKLVKSEKKLR